MNAFPVAVLSMGALVFVSAVAFCAPTRRSAIIAVALAIVAAACLGAALAVFVVTPAYD